MSAKTDFFPAMSSTSSAILLDLDGTLTDPGLGIGRCIAFALEGLGLPLPAPAELRSWIGPPLRHSFARYFENLDVPADPDTALARYRERFGETGIFENELYPGIPDWLAGLAQDGNRLLLATSKPHVYANRIVRHFGLDAWLEGIYGSELDGRRVDKVELLAHVIEREGLDASECMMIGDREHDMLAARFHGMTAVGVLWGYGSERELTLAGAHRLITEPQQLDTILSTCRNDRQK